MVFIKLSAYVPESTALSTMASFLSIDMGTFIQWFLMMKISLTASCSIFLKSPRKPQSRAQDIIDYVQLPDVQEKLTGSGLKSNISLRTAQQWLKKLGWRYGIKGNGMYLNGHEQEDVVNYRKDFVARWAEYEKCMVQYGNDRKIATIPSGFPVEQVIWFCLILLTHDKSTFFADHQCKNSWHAPGSKPTPERKHEGESLMVSEFLSPEWGSLRDDFLLGGKEP